MFKTIEKNVTEEIVVKKSKFIANIFYVETIDQAENLIKQVKKKNFGARHNCFAFSVTTKDGIIKKSSDDGEPSGTAGAPMLNILEKNEISNILIVVTRYFGGILLGTGGLVRAYSDAVMEALKKVQIVKEEIGMELLICLNYQDFEPFKYYCKKNNISIINVEYDKYINCYVEVTNKEKERIIANKEENKYKVEKYRIISEKHVRKK